MNFVFLSIPVHVDWTFGIVPLLLFGVYMVFAKYVFYSWLSTREQILVASIASIVTTLTLIVHEFSHLSVALAFDVPVEMVLFYRGGGGVLPVNYDSWPDYVKALVCLAGPLSSLPLAFIFLGIAKNLPRAITRRVLSFTGAVILFKSVTTLLPFPGNDGARALQAIVAMTFGPNIYIQIILGAIMVFLLFWALFGVFVWYHRGSHNEN